MPAWKEKLADKMEAQLAKEIDVFETEIALRKQGKLEEKIVFVYRGRDHMTGWRM